MLIQIVENSFEPKLECYYLSMTMYNAPRLVLTYVFII